MGKLYRPRHGSLQFWPRKRAKKEIPSVNWNSLKKISVKNSKDGKWEVATYLSEPIMKRIKKAFKFKKYY